jgi:hypothetical protein
MLEISLASAIGGAIFGFCAVLSGAIASILISHIVPQRWLKTFSQTRVDPMHEISRLQIEFYERRDRKLLVRLKNPTDETFSSPRFRIVARDPQGLLVEEADVMSMCVLPAHESTEMLLTIYDEVERVAILSNENSVDLELTYVS